MLLSDTFNPKNSPPPDKLKKLFVGLSFIFTATIRKNVSSRSIIYILFSVRSLVLLKKKILKGHFILEGVVIAHVVLHVVHSSKEPRVT
jgi:hypothetical protein